MKQQNEYTEQAERFLQENGIQMRAAFSKFGKHFDDDKTSRDIFYVEFERGDRPAFGVRFGQSVLDSTGNGDTPPTAYDVLSCLTKNDPGDFEDFCSEFGYDTDSRKAYATWEAVREEWRKVESFFTESELEQLSEIN